MQIFLKLRAWQMFVLILLPMIIPISLFSGGESMKFFGIKILVWMLILVGWIYSVGNTANSKLPVSLRKNPLVYRAGYLIAIFYSIIMTVYIFPNLILSKGPQLFPVWAIPLHLLSTFGMFYGLWFTAKQFVTLQKGEEVRFIDFSGPFFLFWFSPIGIWFLQPKINELFFPQSHNKTIN